MSPDANAFQIWLDSLSSWHGWLQLSPERAYTHAEEDYDQHYGVISAEPAEGQGLCALLKAHAVDLSGPALEIGCGTGRLTGGLAQEYPGTDFLVTDPSPAFLRLTQNQLGAGTGIKPRLHFGVLNGDNLGQVPSGIFSLVALRSTLHHILEVEPFIANCARILRPNGALAMGAEPCESGYMLMATVAHSIAPVLENGGVKLQAEWTEQLRTFIDTVKFYCRRDLDKKAAEDKHLFQVHELSDLGRAHGLRLHFFPNATFADYVPPFLPEFESFSAFFLNYLQFSMQFDPEFLKHIRRFLRPQLKYIDDCYRGHIGPIITGVFLLKKGAG